LQTASLSIKPRKVTFVLTKRKSIIIPNKKLTWQILKTVKFTGFGFVNSFHKIHIVQKRLCRNLSNLRLKVVVDYTLPWGPGSASRGGLFEPHGGLWLSETVAQSWDACSNLWNKVRHWFWEQKLLEGFLKGPSLELLDCPHRPTNLRPRVRGARARLRVLNLHAQKILENYELGW